MCGIAGLFLKDAKLEPDLGSMLAGMLSPLSDRGPDSAGFAVYGAETPGDLKFTLRGPEDFDFDPVIKSVRDGLGVDALGAKVGHRIYDTHLVMSVPADRKALVRQALAAFPNVDIVG